MDIIKTKKIEESEFEAAKRSLVHDLMSRESTVSGAGKLAILNCLRRTPAGFNEFVENDVFSEF